MNCGVGDGAGGDGDSNDNGVGMMVSVPQESAQRASGEACTTKVTFTRAMLYMKAFPLSSCQGLALQLRSMNARRRQPEPRVDPEV